MTPGNGGRQPGRTGIATAEEVSPSVTGRMIAGVSNRAFMLPPQSLVAEELRIVALVPLVANNVDAGELTSCRSLAKARTALRRGCK